MTNLTTDQKAIVDAGLLDESCVLRLPTGGGKTWLARKAIRTTIERGLKAVYLSPLRALARELAVAWRDEFAGFRVGVYTGELGLDADDDIPTPAEADILIFTPEKLDLHTRSWTEHLGWLARVDLVVVDELHTLAGGRRGATLEGLITRFRAINPYARFVGLSATLGNAPQLAGWLGGKAFESNNRPIPLAWRIRTHAKNETKAELVVEEAQDTIRAGGQVIVFVQSRPRTESLVKRLEQAGITAAAHHAGLARTTRDRAEQGFRRGELKAIVCTPTLAMGLNLPGRKVILHDLQRWDNGGWTDLSTNEVWQLAGRAGRPGLDDRGEVVLLAPAWNQKAARRYIAGHFEAITSELVGEASFGEQLMVSFGSRLAVKPAQAERVMGATLFGKLATPGSLTRRVEQSVQDMTRAGMLERSDEGYVRATRLGRIATRFQLTPRTVLAWKQLEDAVKGATLFDLLLAMCGSQDFTARLRIDHDELPGLQAALDAEPMKIRDLAETDRRRVVGVAGRDFAAAVKTALALRAWTRLGDLDEAAAVFHAMEHEIEEARKEAVRMLQAFVAMANAVPRKATDHGIADEAGLAEKAGALSAMVCAGLDDEQATLALIDGVGPVMARRLARAGFKDIEDLAQASAEEIARTDGVSLKRAAKWVKEAGDLVTKGGALRYREVCNEVVHTQVTGRLAKGLDYFRWARASRLIVSPESEGWTVTGGNAPHRVQRAPNGRLQCDCADALRSRLCKHKIAVLHLEGDDGIPKFDEPFPGGDGRLALEAEWSMGTWASNSKCR